MYDTINSWLPIYDIGKTNLNNVLQNLSDVTEHKSSNNNEYISGMLDNYKVYISESGISFKGSLAKFYLKDNLNTLTRSDTKRAIEKMADLTSLPISKASITRLDFANNYLMKHKPETYYQFLGASTYYKRLDNGSTLYFRNGLREKLFYDKIAECKAKKVKLPDIVKGKNVLRFEIRYKKRLVNQFGQKVKASTLSDEKFYMNLYDKYFDEYKKIDKLNIIKPGLETMKSPKDFHKYLELIAISYLGQDQVLNMIDTIKKQGVFDKQEYYSRLKNDIKRLSNMPDQTETSKLITELDNKIIKSKRYYN